MKSSDKMILGYAIGGIIVIILVPLVIYLITTLIDDIYKIEIIHDRILKWSIVAVLMIVGLSFGLSSIIYQNVIGKGGPLEISNIEISPKTKYLVVSGPYRLTRNPMLFGTLVIYLAVALMINSLTAIFLVAIFAVVMLRVVVKKEEERLLKDFGKEYREYRKKTSMIIPWFPKKDTQ